MSANPIARRGPISAAWRWSVRRSPIMLAARGVAERVRRHRLAAPLIRESGLNEPVRDRLGAIVRATRLHASEQADVARELIAHARDASDAGTPEPEVLASLGDPRHVGRLIRRAVKRKRPLPYQIRRWTTRAVLGSLALVLVSYIVLAARFHAGSPSIKTDYLARLNAPVRALPEAEKAWPVYLDALSEWKRVEQRLVETSRADPAAEDKSHTYAGVYSIYDVPRDHPDYDATVAALRAFRPTLDRVSAAAARPAIGVIYSDRTEQLAIEGTDSTITVAVEPAPDPADQEALLAALLPHLGYARTLARVYAFDIRLALDEGDADRIAADLHALLGLARQLSSEPGLISSLVGIAVHDLAMARLGLVVHESPDLLSRNDLVALSHAIAAGRDSTLDLGLDMERMFFQDLMQRAFTDDGRGRGRLTPEGVRLLAELTERPTDFGVVPEHDTPWLVRSSASLAGPLVDASVMGRARQSAAHEQLILVAEQTLAAGPAAMPDLIARFDGRLREMERDELAWRPLIDVVPNLTSAVGTTFRARAHADAMAALLSAAAYKRDHGDWPESLEQLVPASLPRLPEDPFDPGATIRYRLQDGSPVIWSAGVDGDDDDARRPPRPYPPGTARVTNLRARFDPATASVAPTSRRPLVVPLGGPTTSAADADWVIFPPED